MSGPVCFLHVQKSAGTSLYEALGAALPAGGLAPRRMDWSNICGFSAWDLLGEQARAQVAADGAEVMALARHRVVSGHFALSNLLRLAPPSRIGTVLREPRARLISYYLYIRVTPGIRESWHPYDPFSAADLPLEDFLAESRTATVSDNRATRMIMHGDPRVRDGEFIAQEDVESLAEDAWLRLCSLGYVGLLESGAETWAGLSDLFGVELRPGAANVTGDRGVRPGSLPVPPTTAEGLDRLERRSAADAILYRRVAARRYGGERPAALFAERNYSDQLGRLEELVAAAAA